LRLSLHNYIYIDHFLRLSSSTLIDR
jgi:hypothetical protein